MSNDGPLSFMKSWEGFLPPNTVLMARRASASTETRAAPAGTQSNTTTQAAPPSAHRILFASPDLGTPSLRELFDKITAALGLSETDFHVLEGTRKEAENFQAETVIAFEAAATETLSGWDGKMLRTYSLAAMAANPGLKKTVWAQLKSAFAESTAGAGSRQERR